jgi:hypothetical protein
LILFITTAKKAGFLALNSSFHTKMGVVSRDRALKASSSSFSTIVAGRFQLRAMVLAVKSDV